MNISNAQDFQEICANANTNGTLVQFKAFEEEIYATGFFSTICGEQAGYLAIYENDSWVPAPVSLSDPGHAMEVINDQLYIARYEESIDSNWVLVFDGTDLSRLGDGVYLTTASGFSELPNIYDIIEYNDEIIACGEFDRVGHASISGIMRWDGTGWLPLGTGLSGNIQNTPPLLFPHQLYVFDGELYVVGNFRFAGDTEVNGIAKWNGTQWSSLGDGFNGTVYSITEYNGAIYAGGSFSQSGNLNLNSIAKWDGTQWISPGFGFISPSANDFTFVHTLEVIDDLLYVAGGLKQILFDDNTMVSCGGIIAYDGQNIDTFNGGVAGNDIEAVIKTNDGNLLIGGGVFGNGYSGLMTSTTSTTEYLENHSIEVFPNPATDILQLSQRVDNYSLLDQFGRFLKDQNTPSQMINLKGFPSGLYYLKYNIRGQSYSTKFIKK